jgi:LAO/AO transport system kinase
VESAELPAPPTRQFDDRAGLVSADVAQRLEERLRAERERSGALAARRREQALAWMWDIVHARLRADFDAHPAVQAALPQMLHDVAAARIAPSAAARALLDRFEE